MTRKHFEAIAAAMRESMPSENWLNKRQQWERDCKALACTFGQFNPNFDSRRFLTACGMEQ